VTLPADLIHRVRAILAAHPGLSWEEAAERAVTPSTVERGAA
jgi:hypothetical protein